MKKQQQFLEQIQYYEVCSYYFSIVKLFESKRKIVNTTDELLHKLQREMSTIHIIYMYIVFPQATKFITKGTLWQYIFNKVHKQMTSFISNSTTR